MAIVSNILHAITPTVVGAATVAFFLQFLICLVPSTVTTYCLQRSALSLPGWCWCNVVSFFVTQILTGLWIGRLKQQRSTLVCLLLVVFDFVIGLLNVNNVSINMGFWSVPVLLGMMAAHTMQRPGSKSYPGRV